MVNMLTTSRISLLIKVQKSVKTESDNLSVLNLGRSAKVLITSMCNASTTSKKEYKNNVEVILWNARLFQFANDNYGIRTIAISK